MKTPNEVLSYFIESLQIEKQLEFDMESWFRLEDGSSVWSPQSVVNACGTSACLAGTVGYRLDPKSKDYCVVPIMKWIGLELNYAGQINHDDPVAVAVEDSLSLLFTSEYTYGHDAPMMLEDVTKERAIEVLQELLDESHDTWESLRSSLETFQINKGYLLQ